MENERRDVAGVSPGVKTGARGRSPISRANDYFRGDFFATSVSGAKKENESARKLDKRFREIS